MVPKTGHEVGKKIALPGCRRDYRSKTANSAVRPGPNASATQGAAVSSRNSRAKIKRIVALDMLPCWASTPREAISAKGSSPNASFSRRRRPA